MLLRTMVLLGGLLLLSACTTPKNPGTPQIPHPEQRPRHVLAIHGGAGAMRRELMSAEQEARYKAGLEAALMHGDSMLRAGAAALDVVEAVIRILEDDTLFNAGRGAVLTSEGRAELDASIMDGARGSAGAVAGVTTVRHPIAAARKVMDASPHVMMTGRGAETFAGNQGLEMVDNRFFIIPSREAQLRKAKEQASGPVPEGWEGRKYGTVGAVALDAAGNLAAGTSTGGMTNKRFGRVGDAPIIGAGTYADNTVCAVSCTGHGEYFIRNVVAYDVAARMRYGGESLSAAADSIIYGKLKRIGGEGGLIAVDRMGRIAMPFNSDGMFRAAITSEGRKEVAIYRD